MVIHFVLAEGMTIFGKAAMPRDFHGAFLCHDFLTFQWFGANVAIKHLEYPNNFIFRRFFK